MHLTQSSLLILDGEIASRSRLVLLPDHVGNLFIFGLLDRGLFNVSMLRVYDNSMESGLIPRYPVDPGQGISVPNHR